MSEKFAIPIAVGILIFAGCRGQMKKPAKTCPGAESVPDSLRLLMLHSESAAPLKANGRCRAKFYSEGKRYNENFNVKIWVSPPAGIYLQGDIFFDGRGIVLGSNENEFWLAIRPKEISTYIWGQWANGNYSDNLKINPRLVLDALGIVEISGEESWSLTNENGFDVLAEQNNGVVTRKLYIDNCKYRVCRIEYFDAGSRMAAITELDGYKEVSKGFSVPTVIKIAKGQNGEKENSVVIVLTLDSVKSAQFNEKQQNLLFNRPVPQKSFKHIYKITENGSMIEQP